MKFTKGPWTVLPEEKDKPYIRIRGTQLGARYKIANALYIEGVGDFEAEEAKANAHLIAASPLMYEMLARAQLALDSASYKLEPGKAKLGDQFIMQDDCLALVKKIREILAKANGN